MNRFKTILILGINLLTNVALAQNTQSWPTSIPEKEGIASNAILNFLNAIDTSRVELHSFILVRHGKIVTNASWSPYSNKNKHILYSITKSFSSTAIGFAVDDKLLSVDDKVQSFFPKYANNNAYFDELTVRHLLTMSVGQNAGTPYSDPIALAVEKNEDWVNIFFNVPILYKPGSRFLYNTLASHVLSAIVEKVTKMKTSDYLNQKLFKPLGITDFDWETSPTEVSTGGWGLRLNPEDMAKVGQFFLQKGKWKGKQILSEAWIKEATTFKIHYKQPIDTINEWNRGYGYQWWLYGNSMYAAQGSEGQSIIILPEHDAVIAITANISGRPNMMNLIRTILIPAMTTSQLPINANSKKALQLKLATLQHLPEKGNINRTVQKTVKLDSNAKDFDSVAINCTLQDCTLQIKTRSDVFTLRFGKEKWQYGQTRKKGPYRMHSPNTFKGLPPFKVVGSYCWLDDNTLKLTLRYLESAHFETITYHFVNNQLNMEIRSSMNVVSRYQNIN